MIYLVGTINGAYCQLKGAETELGHFVKTLHWRAYAEKHETQLLKTKNIFRDYLDLQRHVETGMRWKNKA